MEKNEKLKLAGIDLVNWTDKMNESLIKIYFIKIFHTLEWKN